MPDMDPSHWQEIDSPDGLYYYNTKTGDSQWEKPECLKSASELADQNTDYYWVQHPTRAWVPAKPLSGSATPGRWVVYETDETLEVKRKAHIGDRIPNVNNTTTNISDLVQLDQVEEPTIIHLLQRRFLRDEIWTSVGDILIAINPFKRTNHFTPTESKQYRGRGMKTLPPHPYLVIDDAYNDMVNKKKDQSILISGESGAGKTYTVRVCMAYVSEIAGSPLGVEKKVMATNRVLESFGNAKTLRNDNSSRFGKFIQLYFDHNHKIVGCAIENYLLEKSRICFQQRAERNYHIFYYLTKQLSAEEKKSLLLDDAETYHYTNQSDTYTGSSHDDEDEFTGARQDFAELGFSAEQVTHIFEVTAAILHMGNIEFDSDGNVGSNVSKATMKHVDDASKLLGVDPAALAKVLTGNINILSSGEKIPVDFNPAAAVSARDALAKGIYGRLFDWLVNAVNEAMFVTAEVAKKCNKIGMVDIFGFEIFKTNYFEQLSINFANEKLQQMFNKHTFLLEEDTYRAEEIQFDPVTFYDSQPLLDILGLKARGNAKLGIYQLLDEQTKISGTDEKFLSAVLQKYKKSTGVKEGKEIKYIVQGRKNKDRFTIEHYAGPVTYTSRGFIEKNADKLFGNQIELMAESSHKMVKELFERDLGELAAALDTAGGGSKKGKSKKGKTTLNTQGGKFLKQLQQMEKDIDQTWPRFIRCIKPNQDKVPNVINGGECLQQLRFAGVFEAVSIRKQGFPFRDKHSEFYRQYRIILKDLMKKESMPPPWKTWKASQFKSASEDLLKELCKLHGLEGLSKIQCGRTMMLYRATEARDLRLRFSTILNHHVVAMQALVRRWQMARIYTELKRCAPVYQAALDSRNIDQLNRALEYSDMIKIKFPMFHLLQKCKVAADVFQAEKELKPKLAALLKGDIADKYKEAAAIIARMDGLIGRDPLAFTSIPDANKVRLAFELERDRRSCDAQATDVLGNLENMHLQQALEKVRDLDQLIKSVKKRAQEQGRQFSFFEKDEAAAALVNLEKESAACSEILESVANNTPQGEALKLDLSQIDQQKLRGALDTCKAVGVTIDSRAALEKGEAFHAMRAELVKAIASGEQKATAAVWKTVASLLETCNDFAGEDTNAELELVNDELAMRSEVEAVLEEMDEALVDLDVAKLGGATAKGSKLKLQKHPDDEIRAKYLAAVETYEAIHRARVALLAALDGFLDEAALEDAVCQAQSSRYGHEGMCGHSMYVRARQALKWVCVLTHQAAVEIGFLRVEQAQSIVQGCKKINLPLADADTLKQFLALPREQQYRRQVEAALDQDSHELQVWRAVECSILEMDEFFSSAENMALYSWHNFEHLMECDIWAKKNKTLFMRSFMQLSQRCWRVPEHGLHAPLTHIVASDSEEEKRLKKYAPEIMKSICAFSGEQARYAKDACAMIHELLEECLNSPEIRNEAFCQLLKHLTPTSRFPDYEAKATDKKRHGPDETSSLLTWRVMLVMLLTFAPRPEFDKYLEQFLRHESTATDLSPTQQACAQLCLRALHQIRIIGDKMVVVDAEEVAKIKTASMFEIVELVKMKAAHKRYAINYVLQNAYSDPEVEPWELEDDGSDFARSGGVGGRARFEALHDYAAADDGEVSFSRGDILVETGASPYPGWRNLLNTGTGRSGLGPSEKFLKAIAPEPSSKPRKPPTPDSSNYGAGGGAAADDSDSDSTSVGAGGAAADNDDDDTVDSDVLAPHAPQAATSTGADEDDLEDGAAYYYAKFPCVAFHFCCRTIPVSERPFEVLTFDAIFLTGTRLRTMTS
eukprot:INCI16293.4.p1 GENE.INCI16293.4~~INCI16293.4.p1  ORF type:complete len:1790 (+),score=389.72 INCI16293.4:196-5565(+)